MRRSSEAGGGVEEKNRLLLNRKCVAGENLDVLRVVIVSISTTGFWIRFYLWSMMDVAPP